MYDRKKICSAQDVTDVSFFVVEVPEIHQEERLQKVFTIQLKE